MISELDPGQKDKKKGCQELETSEKLRINLKQQELLVEQLRKRLESNQQKLEIEEEVRRAL